jgi:hypothetical protein
MSSSSSAADATTLAAALGVPSMENLTQDNFMFWNMQPLHAICGAQVIWLLDGFDTSPMKTPEDEDEEKKRNKLCPTLPMVSVACTRSRSLELSSQKILVGHSRLDCQPRTHV